MTLDRDKIKSRIRTRIHQLATALGYQGAADLKDDEIIPATGLLDSASLLELVVWYEMEFDLPLKQEEINVDHLGSINAMTDFLIARKSN